ncbi:MAG: GxxExxY protein [Desulfobacterales bacterium]|jgi:GxxExxY protein|nr:GxxExxY protein [Desulfobacterales bacterium]
MVVAAQAPARLQGWAIRCTEHSLFQFDWQLFMEFEGITHKIIGAAYKVFNALGFGYLESVYQKALMIELAKEGLKAEDQKPLKVYYDGESVGEFFVDLFVEETVIVELKSVQHLAKEHEVQLVNYLSGLKRDIGLLINFGPTGVKIKRKYRNLKKNDPQEQQLSKQLR